MATFFISDRSSYFIWIIVLDILSIWESVRVWLEWGELPGNGVKGYRQGKEKILDKIFYISESAQCCFFCLSLPDKHVIIISKQCFGIMITSLLRCVFARMVLWKAFHFSMNHQKDTDYYNSMQNCFIKFINSRLISKIYLKKI